MRGVSSLGCSAALMAAGFVALVGVTAACGGARSALSAHQPARHGGPMARALARRLLADLRLPPGSGRLPWRLRPRALGPGLVAPLTDVVDLRALYRLSQPILPADAFAISHIGVGLVDRTREAA